MRSPDDRPSALPASSANSGRTGRVAAWLARRDVRRILFAFALFGLFWKPSNGLASALLVLCGIRNAFLPDAFRPWRSPAGFCLLAGCLVLVSASLFGFSPAGSWRDFAKLLPLAVFVSSLPGWLARGDNLSRALTGTAAVLTARLGVELCRIAAVCGSFPALLEKARHTQPYLFTHPNVSSMTALLLVFVWGAGCLRAKRPSVRCLAAGCAAFCLFFAYAMGSRGPQAAFAAVALFVPLLLLPGWKARALWALLAAVLLLPAVWAFHLRTQAPPEDMPPAARCIQRAMDALNPRFGDLATLRDLSGREVVWSHTDYLLRTQGRTWRGYGFGKRVFRKAYYENPAQRPPRMRRPVFFPHAHSYYRQIRFEGGNGALACFVLAWAAAWLGGLAAFVRRRRAFAGTGFRARLASGATEAVPLAMSALVLVYGGWDYPDALLRVLQYMVFAALLALPFRGK
ncbi:MAG: O-antigen ligase family protein [Kiritimatiellae bacterium]|nr:O-antigen ligase family protein [Kiritimatiellia bacterium]